MRFVEVTLAAPTDLHDFYGGQLGLPLDGDSIRIGETKLRVEPSEGEPFYHFALLVPGDRFDAALAWAREHVELLGDVFDFENWDALAVYFHDPAGNIVELIAHAELCRSGRTGPFDPGEMCAISEVGLVVDDRGLALRGLAARGIELWSGSDGPGGLSFVGRKGETLILVAPGRGWLPIGTPAERCAATVMVSVDGAEVAVSVYDGELSA